MTSPLRASVRAEFVRFSERFEGRISHLYADCLGLVTIAAGALVDPVEMALTLPLVHNADGLPATREEIRAEWQRVKTTPDLARLGHTAAAKVCRLHLTPADLDALTYARLDAAVAGLARGLPSFGALPADAQLALLSMAWAVGTSGVLDGYPRMMAAIRAGDFATAAAECTIREVDNLGVVPRNRADRLLFLAAAWVADTGADPEPLRWAPPADEAPPPEPGPTLRDEAMRAWGMQIPVENEPPPSGRG